MLNGSTPLPETMKRAPFARLIGRDKSAVTHWANTGKLTGEAIAPNGDIRPAVAIAQLGISLDLGQQLAQERPILLSNDQAPAAHASKPASTSSEQQLLLKAKREEAEANAAAAKRKEASQNGKWVSRDEAGAEWGRVLTQLIADLDNSIEGIAERMAAKFKIDDRAAAFALREELRDWRARVAREATTEAEQLPAELEATAA